MSDTHKQNHQRRSVLLEEFQSAPDEAWFTQQTVAAVRLCSLATVERDRWSGTGIPYIKCGRSVRYSKRSILEWLSQQKSVCSTTHYQQLQKDK